MTLDQNTFKEIFWITLKNWDFTLLNHFDSVMTNIMTNNIGLQ